MIDTGENNLDVLRDRQPFRVPDGYFKDFTDDFMRSLPKKAVLETKVISLFDRVKPWLHLAAMFAGIIILFNVYNKTLGIPKDNNDAGLTSINVAAEENDDADFGLFIEEQYADKLALAYVLDVYDDN